MELDVTSVRTEEILNRKRTKEKISIYNIVLLCRGNANINKEDMDIVMNTFKIKKSFTLYSRKSIKKHRNF